MLSKKEYENIITKNDKFTEDTYIALGLVKKYVCENKLLIVGGMAIDFALRLKGEKLYEDDVLPDYDFYSPNYNTDAYHIAEKLKKAGLNNISVINANHISTMRVRVNYTVVADVTYMPKNIFDKLPFLVYRDIRIIHPQYQMIDQHRALSYPYENPPWEVITHRWKKDAGRYDLLYSYFPLKDKDFNPNIGGGKKEENPKEENPKENDLKTLITEYSKDYKYQKKYLKYLCEDIKKEFKPFETIGDISSELKYQHGAKLIKPQVHIGQRKLFLTELQFLTQVLPTKKEPYYCIYAGSSPSNKTHYLSQLFPQIKFILIDPNKFDIKLPNMTNHRQQKHNDIIHLYYDYPTKSNIYKLNKKEHDMIQNEKKEYIDFIQKTNYKIYIIEDYMTDAYAELFKDLNHCFISDIRSNMSEKGNPTEFDIYWNSSMMFNWISILQPDNSMLKFRPIYSESNKIEYKDMNEFKISKKYGIDFKSDIENNTYHMPKATLYLQTWAGKTSSELRMWIKKKDIFNIVPYDSEIIENKLFYFNSISRGLCYHTNKNSNESLHFCHCNDCALENKIWEDYINLIKKGDINNFIIQLNNITHRPLNKVHNSFIYEKLTYDIFLEYTKQDVIDREQRLKQNIGKKYVKKKGDLGTEGGMEVSPLMEESKIPLMAEIIISSVMFNNQCVSGFAGLLYWEAQAKKMGYKNKHLSLGTIEEDGGGFIFQVPANSNGISIYSNNVIQLLNEIKKNEGVVEEHQYNRFLDKLPHKFILKTETKNMYEFFDNGGYMLGAYKTDIDIYIANLQNIMLYMLTNIIWLKNIMGVDNIFPYYIGYITAQSIVEWAGDSYKKEKNKAKYIPFLPTVEVYGNEEISDSYINSKRQFLEKIKEREPEKLQPGIIFPDTFDHGKIPEKYYKFDPKKSPILQFDGTKSQKYYNRIYIN